MKQIFQSLKNGKTEVLNIPCPDVKPGHILIKSRCSLVSVGTEKMLVDFGKANIFKKAQQQPDKVKLVMQKMATKGVRPTLEAVFDKLDEPMPVGYSNVGSVLCIGEGDETFKIGDRVVSNGRHAEMVRVPYNLSAKIPDNVSDEEASFTVLGSIALQGIRLVSPTLGETIVVTGLGLIGLLTVQLLRAHGCKVIGIDYDEAKCNLAKSFGAEVVNLSKQEEPVKVAERYSKGRGVDAVIITASTTSSKPVHEAATMCRKRGRIVLVGVTGLELSRADFYEKELTFQVSCSYGPGRYDPQYEVHGHDYPFGFVRWTEQRNMEAVLEMISNKSLVLEPLISHSFEVDDANLAYNLIAGEHQALGIIITYPQTHADVESRVLNLTDDILSNEKNSERNNANVSFIGSGNYASTTLIPAFKKSGANFYSIASSVGISSTILGRRHGFLTSTTDTETVFSDKDVDTIVITTQHNTHAKYVLKSLESGKNVFVEKPLCISLAELDTITSAYLNSHVKLGKRPLCMIGFNRRFAPQIQKMKQLLDTCAETKSFIMSINAGQIPKSHWTQQKDIGGGRIIGEVCHFVDLLRFLAGFKISSWSIMNMEAETTDTVSISLKFEDGSIGSINYFSNGSSSLSKERLEVFCGGRVLQLDNYKKLVGHGWNGFSKMNLWQQDKGQSNCVEQFIQAVVKNKQAPINFEEILEVSRTTIEMSNSLL